QGREVAHEVALDRPHLGRGLPTFLPGRLAVEGVYVGDRAGGAEQHRRRAPSRVDLQGGQILVDVEADQPGRDRVRAGPAAGAAGGLRLQVLPEGLQVVEELVHHRRLFRAKVGRWSGRTGGTCPTYRSAPRATASTRTASFSAARGVCPGRKAPGR